MKAIWLRFTAWWTGLIGRDFEWWARIITLSYLSLFLGVVVARMKEFLFLPLNELGDFAAGVFAPLAFLWLVLGYRQQGKELSASTRALDQQVQELKASFALQREAAEKQDRMLDPALLVRWLNSKGNSSGPYLQFEIENTGESCRNMDVLYESLISPSESFTGTVAVPLFHGQKVMVKGPGFCDAAKILLLKIHYVRSNGSRGVQEFVFNAQNGLVEPKPIVILR